MNGAHPGEDPSPAGAEDGPLRFLRAHHAGVLLADGVPGHRRFVTDPADGALVMCLDDDPLLADELVLWVPEETIDPGTDTMQLLLEASAIDAEREAVCDRFRAYHPASVGTHWIRARIESARWGSEIIDGATLMRPNELAGAQGPLCRVLNADASRLGVLCRRLTGVRPEHPVAVGLDPMGIDVRARFGIVRCEPATALSDPTVAGEIVSKLLGEDA